MIGHCWRAWWRAPTCLFRTWAPVRRRGRDPLAYDHRHPSMKRFAELLALRYDQPRTLQAYYRQLRLIAAESLR